MALKGDRQIDAVEIGFYVNEIAEKGSPVCISTVGSGVALDSTSNVATRPSLASGQKPIGILLEDFVNVDLTRTTVNWHRDQANSGDKACIVTKGWVDTNQVAPNAVGGNKAVLANGSIISGIAIGATWNEANNPFIGRFRTSVDQAGYARVYTDL